MLNYRDAGLNDFIFILVHFLSSTQLTLRFSIQNENFYFFPARQTEIFLIPPPPRPATFKLY